MKLDKDDIQEVLSSLKYGIILIDFLNWTFVVNVRYLIKKDLLKLG